MLISSKAVNHEAAGGLSIVAVSVGRKKSRFLVESKEGGEVNLNVMRRKGEGGKIKNDFEKSEQFETKDVGRVISTSSVLVLTRKREREKEKAEQEWQNDPMHAKARKRYDFTSERQKSPKVYYSSINLMNASNKEY
eukprot:scaffold8008_cov141-Skeletonema_marinoi.AAC.1